MSGSRWLRDEGWRPRRRPGSRRGHTGNGLTAVAPVNPEVRIGRQEHRVGDDLGHPHETRVREARGKIRVLLHELQDRLDMVPEVERHGYLLNDTATTE